MLLLLPPCSLRAAADKDYFVGAYYYPWYGNNNFHDASNPTGQNTLVYHLNPRITPKLGWYNQTHSDVISQHYKWARYAGIDFFVTSYWGQGKTEDTVIRNYMFDNPDRGNIKLAVFIETQGAALSVSKITNETNYLCDNYFNRSGYFRFDGKPVIFIYVTRSMPKDPNLTTYITNIRNAARDKGVGEVYIVGDEVWGNPNPTSEPNRVMLMDAVTNYDIYGNMGRPAFATDSILSTYQSKNTSWKNLVNSLGRQFIPAVTPGFNNRGPGKSTLVPMSRKFNDESHAFGTLFSAMLDKAKLSVDVNNMIMITSWNEWHEDTEIEPTIFAPPTNVDDSNTTQFYTNGLYYNGFGMLYLNILRAKTTLFAPCDYDNDSRVAFDDLAFLLDSWLDTSSIEADLAISGDVDFADFALCTQSWSGP
jgi:glycoprotein endo-alpha-1,2-mannosidase